MANSSPTPSTSDLVDGTLTVAAGVGIVTTSFFPLAIPMLALTAVALLPLLIPLLLIALAGGLVAAPFLLLRRLLRRYAAGAARPSARSLRSACSPSYHPSTSRPSPSRPS